MWQHTHPVCTKLEQVWEQQQSLWHEDRGRRAIATKKGRSAATLHDGELNGSYLGFGRAIATKKGRSAATLHDGELKVSYLGFRRAIATKKGRSAATLHDG
jgi:hypothetical protein